MQVYELATLSTTIGAAPKLTPAIEAFCREPGAGGQLLGAWATDLGALNQVLVLRGFDSEAALRAERQRTQDSSSPFGAGALLTGIALDSYAPLPGLPPVEIGARGPVYEVRSYVMKPNGKLPMIAAWQAALPARLTISPIVVAMTSLEGPPRLTHIWPYPSLNDRAAIRAEAVSRGNWPPAGGPDWLTTAMQSWICLPLPGSPLR
jgi:hypothetical protein